MEEMNFLRKLIVSIEVKREKRICFGGSCCNI